MTFQVFARVAIGGLFGAWICNPLPAWAHPGHVHEVVSADSAAHYVLQPEHAAAWLAVVATAGLSLWLISRKRAIGASLKANRIRK